ncbi:universal stress protein [Streptomyces chattanoogensis]|uniref:Universal stress protein n=1 Tax=Streptomyces chattanoogensis TaxID=66876 RepID=A0A0N0XWT8_9ACTN|nr:universal stress protein [Streptomyces chattanoogensis]KPC64336.1 universal stress protein [Streptomyces chattanoogensis]
MGIPVVVGVDGSEAGLEAVDWAADEAVRHTVPLRLVHVATPDQLPHPLTGHPNHASPAVRVGREPASDQDVQETADSIVTSATTRARQRAPTVQLSGEVLYGDAAAALTGKGRNAFALVLGSRGLGDLAGLLLGSVSLAVAARADCPVVVVRGGVEHRDSRFGNVVVGIEDGAGSGTALQFALREAQVGRCGLTAVHARCTATSGSPETTAPADWTPEAQRRSPGQVLDDALHGPGDRCPHVVVSRRAVEGPAREALLEAASGADLLVVGARRRRGHFGLQLGLVNHGVLHHSPCPVAVVPQI